MPKCPFNSNKYFSNDSQLEVHLEKEHSEQLHGLSAANFLFNIRNNKSHGNCVICGKKTIFNENTKKYNRLCDDPRCKELYIEQFKERMKKKYGKEHLLDDPDKQKEMLAKRKIAQEYKWSNGEIVRVVGTHELYFLQYMDIGLNWPLEDIVNPCPIVFKYKYKGLNKFYIPDFYVPSLKLVIEIKAYNPHYQQRDLPLEKLKDKSVLNTNEYNFIKILDKNYDEFLEKLVNNKWKVK
jgi:hypothetical protein